MFYFMKLNFSRFAVVLVAFSLLAACQTTATEPVQVAETRDCFSEAPLPNYTVTTPLDSVPSNTRGFSGIWVGHWSDIQVGNDEALCHILVVENINDQGEVKIIYSSGVYRPWGLNSGEYGRYNAKVTPNGKLYATLGNGVEVSYQMNAEGNLTGNYKHGVAFGTLRKTD